MESVVTAQVIAFSGNPRPRETKAESALVLILPVMRIEREHDDCGDRRGRRQRIPIKSGDEDPLRFDSWGELPVTPVPWLHFTPNCRCSLTPDRYSMEDKRRIFDALMSGDFDTYEAILASYHGKRAQ
jgi:hypothetical protein